MGWRAGGAGIMKNIEKGGGTLIVHGPWQVPGTTKGDKTRVISGERLYEGLFKFT